MVCRRKSLCCFFFLSVLQLKTTLKRHVSTELFTLSNKRAFLSPSLLSFPLTLPAISMYGWRKMIAVIVWQQQSQILFWKQVGSGSRVCTERKKKESSLAR